MNPNIYKLEIDWIFRHLNDPYLTDEQKDLMYREADWCAVQILKATR